MIETASGVVLRTRPLTESSLIVQWLTPGLGRLATVAKGAHRPKSPFRGKLDLFYQAEFSFMRSRRSELHNLREVSVGETHPALRQDIARLQQAAYCAALVEQATEPETPLAEMFELFSGMLSHVSVRGAEPQTVLAFELKLLNQLGLQPVLEETSLKPGTRQIAAKLQEGDWALIARLKPSAAQGQELSQFLRGYIGYHLERLPKGREAAVGVG